MALKDVTKPVMLDETGNRIVDSLDAQSAILQVMAGTSITSLYTNFKQLHDLAESGCASRILSIGDQINVPWKDVDNNNTEYVMPFDVVHFGDVTLKDGETKPGIWLQSHYATVASIQFGNAEAFYSATAELPAGTYYLTLGATWGKATSGKSYQFTLTQNVPSGGQLRGFVGMPDVVPENWKVSSYSSPSATKAIETVSVSEGTAGTDLGTMPINGATDTTAAYPLNCMQHTGYGNNRWQNSAYEQWLNSAAGKSAWWTPRDVYDVPPDQLSSRSGFMAGFGDDFLAILGKIKVSTAKNTTCYDGSTDDTYDTFFLPSLEQMYGTPQIKGIEGDYWEYWKQALGITSPAAYNPTLYDAYKAYALDAKTSEQNLPLRSAYRANSCDTWNVYGVGALDAGGGASTSYRCAPACVIC